jgi:DNA-binding transcriptional MocR family regulator
VIESIQYRFKAGSAAALVEEVESAVARGALAPGQELPSVRRLAAQAGISPATVAAGLAELRRRGVVVSEQRRGTRIGQAPPIGAALAPLPVPAGARDLSRGNPDPALLPDLGRVLRRIELPARLYGEAPEHAGLIELAHRQLLDDGVPGEELCVVSGALDGIERVLQSHLRPGDRVAVENPGYAALYDLLRAQGLGLDGVEVDDRGMRPERLQQVLARGASAVIVTPRGQNPVGAALDAGRARELRAVLDRHPDVLLIEDDHLGPVAGCALHTLAPRRRWAATRSVAKALGPDLRLAVLTGDAQTVSRVRGRQLCGPGWVSHVLQTLVFELWSDEAVREGVERACDVYAERREGLIAALAKRSVAASGSSGLNVWVPVSEEAGVMAALLQRGWVVAPGIRYRLGESTPAIRITSATLTASESLRLADDLAVVLLPDPASRSG